MKVREVLELLDQAEANVKMAIVAYQARIFESPYTSWEFTQKSLELQDILDELKTLRKKLESMNPEEEFKDEGVIKALVRLKNLRSHAL
ncbi:hypothetical protein A3L04_03555 [Thermococcus chitonophagus]|uniref:Uncharacterized protein n=1 Tax=Thermococcus chitonophagus TaxID=54262 RepID=A0A170SXH1_9EURY|nr:hypothetical protein [Thermococcus chitonophagus]ASJ16221.1 hypothetical protein A3L04_03555 [Thermococcus chitonophagus]CUX78807.1 hypothetical protein CHITON_2028 [Thermococcus chitonophagus]